MSPPSGRIVARAPTLHTRRVQHRLDPLAQSGGGLWYPLPYRSENLQHVVGANRRGRQIADHRKGVSF
jgi:hypothetical protein